jgi:hypothetical protein
MILYTILALSLLINAVLLWYAIYAIRKLLFISDNANLLLEAIENFSSHLENLYELETYYGDETLKGLLRHSKSVVDDIKHHNDVYSLFEEEEIEEEKD